MNLERNRLAGDLVGKAGDQRANSDVIHLIVIDEHRVAGVVRTVEQRIAEPKTVVPIAVHNVRIALHGVPQAREYRRGGSAPRFRPPQDKEEP